MIFANVSYHNLGPVMENKYVISQAATAYGPESVIDESKSDVPVNMSSDALTAPTRRQMNSVKNQFEGEFTFQQFCIVESIMVHAKRARSGDLVDGAWYFIISLLYPTETFRWV